MTEFIKANKQILRSAQDDSRFAPFDCASLDYARDRQGRQDDSVKQFFNELLTGQPSPWRMPGEP